GGGGRSGGGVGGGGREVCSPAPAGSSPAPDKLRSFAEAPPPIGPELWKWQLARAGYLMKADLTTRMVIELPELRGVIGRAYAERSEERRVGQEGTAGWRRDHRHT